jgi:hypothetical protein
MSTKIPRVIADLELQLATAIAVGGTSFTLASATDDDGEALPAGVYVFTVDSGTSNKEYLLGQLNDLDVTSVQSVSRQGVQTSGAARAHRIGSPVILTNFAALQLVADTLRGAVELDGANPLSYDVAPTLSDGKELATVQYVLDTATGGTVAFDAQTIAGNAGESVVAGDLVYFNTSDQEWYKTDADTAATVNGVQLGVALGSGSDGAGISGGVQISGTYTTTGLTAGSLYYASNTAGAIATTAGTTKQVIGVALSTTKLLLLLPNPTTLTSREKDALAGGGDFGTPSTSNKFVTEDFQVGYINTLLQGTSPVVESTASGVDNTSTGTNIITMPSGITAGDLLIVFFSNLTSVDSTASGWTRISQSGSSFSHVFAKIAVGSDTCTVVTGANQVSAWASYRISGWKNSADLSQIKINEVSGDTSSLLIPFEITKNCLWLSCRTHTGTGTYTAVPTNYSDLVTATSTGGGASVGTARRSAVLFNETPGTFTTSGTRNNIRSYVLAIRPSNT